MTVALGALTVGVAALSAGPQIITAVQAALAYDEMGESINMDADALERFVEKAAKQEKYESQFSRLSELYREQAEISARLDAAQEALSEAQETGSGNTRTLQNDINELTAAQEANAQQIAELEEASREYGEQQAEAAQKTSEMTSRIDEINGKMHTTFQNSRKLTPSGIYTFHSPIKAQKTNIANRFTTSDTTVASYTASCRKRWK